MIESGCGGLHGYDLDWVVKESLIERILFEWRPEESQGGNGFVKIWGQFEHCLRQKNPSAKAPGWNEFGTLEKQKEGQDG